MWNGFTKSLSLGRFGWKANTPTVAHQTAGAANGDMGITSRPFPEEECMPAQKDCRDAPRGGKPEINDKNIGTIRSSVKMT